MRRLWNAPVFVVLAAAALTSPAVGGTPSADEVQTQLLKLQQGNQGERTSAAIDLARFYEALPVASPDREKIVQALVRALPDSVDGVVSVGTPATTSLLGVLRDGDQKRAAATALGHVFRVMYNPTYSIPGFITPVAKRISSQKPLQQAVHGLIDAYRTGDVELKTSVTEALGQIGPDAIDALPVLIDATKSLAAGATEPKDASLLYETLRSLWTWSTPYYLTGQIDSDPRRQAELDKEELRYEGESIRIRQSLADLVPTLLAMLQRADIDSGRFGAGYSLRVPAGLLLTNLHSKEFAKGLATEFASAQPDDFHWIRSSQELEAMGGDALDPLVELVTSSSADTTHRAGAIRIIGRVVKLLKDQAKWDATAYARFKRDHPAAAAARQALKLPAKTKAIDAVRAAAKEQDFRIREAAGEALKVAGE